MMKKSIVTIALIGLVKIVVTSRPIIPNTVIEINLDKVNTIK